MDDATLRERLWLGFARLQTLLGGQAGGGSVIEDEGFVASVVPSAPDSPTLNATVSLDSPRTVAALPELHRRYGDVIHRISFYAPYQANPDRWRKVLADLKAA